MPQLKTDDYYREVVDKCKDILDQTLTSEHLASLSESHASIFDFQIWLQIVEGKPESNMFRVAIREYQMALLCLNFGQYNLSFAGLRFFLERALVAIFLSSKEIDLRLWERGERDTYWNEIVDRDNGLLSTKFSRAFFPELKDEIEIHRSIAAKVYRECSEFIHANPGAQGRIPETLQFDGLIVKEWHSKAKTISDLVHFCLCLRYLKSIPRENLDRLESTILDNLSHIEPIRLFFGGPASEE